MVGGFTVRDERRPHIFTSRRTLVGSGLMNKTETRKNMASVLPKGVSHIPENVQSFQPESSSLTTTSGRKVSYDSLVVAPGLQTNWDGISGLPKALADPTSGVSSIYSYETCDKVWADVDALRSGNAIFTQPAGIVKCAGGKQSVTLLLVSFLSHHTTFPSSPESHVDGLGSLPEDRQG